MNLAEMRSNFMPRRKAHMQTMNKIFCIRIQTTLALFLCLMLSSSFFAQSKKSLQTQKSKLQKDISYTSKLLKETQQDKKNSISQIEKLNKSIEQRTELISTIESEISLLETEIVNNRREVDKKNASLKKLKEQYAEMVFRAWLNRTQFNRALYVFSAQNFNQAVRRVQYFNQVNDIRQQRLDEITETNRKLQEKIDELRKNREEKANALKEQNLQTKKLEEDKKTKEVTLTKLKSKEKELTAKIKKKEDEKKKLEDKIKAIIDKELKEAEEKKKKTPTTTKAPTKETIKESTKEVKATPGGSLSGSGFSSNKGKLPWPVEKGVITGKFGTQPHPVFSNIEIKNDGIDITTDKGASVRSVFKGEVTGVFKVDGYENVVIIRHGDYLTVYSNLASVIISKGNQVEAKQKIGLVATDEDGKTYLNFQIRLGSVVQNPTVWLSR